MAPRARARRWRRRQLVLAFFSAGVFYLCVAWRLSSQLHRPSANDPLDADLPEEEEREQQHLLQMLQGEAGESDAYSEAGEEVEQASASLPRHKGDSDELDVEVKSLLQLDNIPMDTTQLDQVAEAVAVQLASNQFQYPLERLLLTQQNYQTLKSKHDALNKPERDLPVSTVKALLLEYKSELRSGKVAHKQNGDDWNEDDDQMQQQQEEERERNQQQQPDDERPAVGQKVFDTCAVVGNSGSLKGSLYGKEIDEAHDVVLRINQVDLLYCKAFT